MQALGASFNIQTDRQGNILLQPKVSPQSYIKSEKKFYAASPTTPKSTRS